MSVMLEYKFTRRTIATGVTEETTHARALSADTENITRSEKRVIATFTIFFSRVREKKSLYRKAMENWKPEISRFFYREKNRTFFVDYLKNYDEGNEILFCFL